MTMEKMLLAIILFSFYCCSIEIFLSLSLGFG